jgi:hypothetical protein
MENNEPPVEEENQETEVEEVQPETVTEEAPAGQSLMALERLIINYLSDIERNNNELKKHTEMLDSVLMNDAEYQEAHKKAKEAAKEKAGVKANLMNRPEAAQLGDKVKSMRAELKDKRTSLSAYLQEYAKQAGTTQFEDDEGQVREIVYMAKVVKRSNKFRT